MRSARSEGGGGVFGLVHVENQLMLTMASDLGFKVHQLESDPAIREVVWHPLGETAAASSAGALTGDLALSKKRAAG